MSNPARRLPPNGELPNTSLLKIELSPSHVEGFLLRDQQSLIPDLKMETYQLEGKEAIGGTIIESKLIVPETILDPVPLGIAPGYLGDAWAYKSLGNYIARNGKPVLLWKFPRRQGLRGTLDLSHALYPQKLACEALWGSIRHMQRRSDIPDIDQSVVDAAGHSRGGATIMRAADRKPDIFRNLIFDGAAGLETHTTRMMIGRLGPFFTEEMIPTLTGRKLKEPIHIAALGLTSYVLGNPIRTLSEAIDVSNEDITALLQKDKVAHIGKAIYGYNADKLIDIHRSIQKSGRYVDLVKINADPKLGHLGPQLQPESVGYDYLQMLKQLNEAKEIRGNHSMAA